MVTCWALLGIVACAAFSVALDLAVWGYRQERRKVLARDALVQRSPVPRSRRRGDGANQDCDAE